MSADQALLPIGIRECIVCGTAVSKQAKKGRCRPCAHKAMNADPEYRRLRDARLAAALQRPEVRQRKLDAGMIAARRRAADPEKRAVLVKNGHLYGKANLAYARTPEVRQSAVRQRRPAVWHGALSDIGRSISLSAAKASGSPNAKQ